MARPKRMTGIDSRVDARGVTHYRGTLYTAATGRRKGPWTPEVELAIEWRDRARQEARAGLLAYQSVTVREAIKVFCAGIADGSIRNRSGRPFKPSVVHEYKRDLKKIDRLLGPRKMDEVRITDAQRVLDYLRRQRTGDGKLLADSTVRHAMMALRSLYQWGRPLGMAAINPCEGLRLPITDERKRERIAPPREAALLAAALPLPDRTAFGLACWAGLRAGELLALDGAHVTENVVSVDRAWDLHPRVDRQYEGLPPGFIPPKSDAAYRDVPILSPLALILDDHFAEFGRDGLLFPSKRDRRRPFSHSALTGRMKERWRLAELEALGLHEARHTFASMLIASGSTPKTVTTYMGHSSIQITYDRYGHLFPGNEAEARDRVNAYLREQMDD